jgi:hypothetical protein
LLMIWLKNCVPASLPLARVVGRIGADLPVFGNASRDSV